MRTITPIRASEITITDRNFLWALGQHTWHELALLLVGSILVVFAIGPAYVFLLVDFFWLSVAWVLVIGTPVMAGYGYLIGRNAGGYKGHLADIFHGGHYFAVRAVLVGLPVCILACAAIGGLPVLASSPPTIVRIGLVLDYAALTLVTLLTVHALPMLVLFDLPLRDVWLYSFSLVIRWPLVSVGLVSMLVLLVYATGWLGLGIGLVTPLLFMSVAVSATMMLTKQTVVAQRQEISDVETRLKFPQMPSVSESEMGH